MMTAFFAIVVIAACQYYFVADLYCSYAASMMTSAATRIVFGRMKKMIQLRNLLSEDITVLLGEVASGSKIIVPALFCGFCVGARLCVTCFCVAC